MITGHHPPVKFACNALKFCHVPPDDGVGRAVQVYLDNMASTRVAPEVLDRITELQRKLPGNPHAYGHPHGSALNALLEEARSKLARLLKRRPRDVVFVPSATAANNLALLGFARKKGSGRVLVSAIEHPSVAIPAHALAQEGLEVVPLQVDRGGLVRLEDLEDKLTHDTALVSVMAVNNETGVVQPVAEIARLCARSGVLFHCDAAQLPGRLPLSTLQDCPVVTLSSHKAYGPMGAAALVLSKRVSSPPSPLLHGGGQEMGLWPGTVNVYSTSGFVEALDLCERRLQRDVTHVRTLSETLWNAILDAFPKARRNGSNTVPHCLNVTIPGIRSETLVSFLASTGISVAAGSACSTAAAEPSRVLLAMGLSREEATQSVRFSLGRYNTQEEILYVADVLRRVATKLARTQ